MAKIATHPIEDAAPFAKAIGVSSPTVWDYPNKTLYLLKR